MRGRTNADGQGVALNANTRKCVVAQNQSVTEGDFVDFVSEYSGGCNFTTGSLGGGISAMFELSDGRYISFMNGVNIIARDGEALSLTVPTLSLNADTWTKIGTDTFLGLTSRTIGASASTTKPILVLEAVVLKFDVSTNLFDISESITKEYEVESLYGYYDSTSSSPFVVDKEVFVLYGIREYSASSQYRYTKVCALKTTFSGTSKSDFSINSNVSITNFERIGGSYPISSITFAKTEFGCVYSCTIRSTNTCFTVSWDESNAEKLTVLGGQNNSFGGSIIGYENRNLYLLTWNKTEYVVNQVYFNSATEYQRFSDAPTNLIPYDKTNYSLPLISCIEDTNNNILVLVSYQGTYSGMVFLIIDVDKTSHKVIVRTVTQDFEKADYFISSIGVVKFDENKLIACNPTKSEHRIVAYGSALLFTYDKIGNLYGGIYDTPVVQPITTPDFVKGVAKNSGVGGEEIMIYTPFV